jgi:hypothetical protein
MWSKISYLLIISILALFSILPDDNIQANTDFNYVKLEVKGQLVQDGTRYAIESNDSIFPQTKLLIKLERSEDKNRFLDRHLDTLKGKMVLAKGFLDCRRIGQEQGVIYLYLNNESQISAAEGK